MKKQLNRKGFTLAELLVVVGIVVILMGVGFIAIMSHMRTMHQLEMDGQAKEIFVAAQNHLAMAEGQGYMGVSATTGFGVKEEPGDSESDQGIYYFVVPAGQGGTLANSTSTVLGQMLPFASVDEAARTGGSYIIRYQKSPGIILDVFYASDPTKDSRYGYSFFPDEDEYKNIMALAETEGMSEAEKKELKEARRSFGTGHKVLGYYGGVNQSDLVRSNTSLQAPALEIINAEKLSIKVTNFNTASTGKLEDQNSLTLIITGANAVDSAVVEQKAFELIKDGVFDDTYRVEESNVFMLTLDSVTGTESEHFYTCMSDFLTGGNIEVKAVAFNNKVATNIAETDTEETNSLFASYDEETGEVEISNLRHLLNLDADISGYAISFSTALQTGDLDWKEFKTNVGDAAGTATGITTAKTSSTYKSSKGSFLPVNLGAITYNGGGKRISNVSVDYESITSPAEGGLFCALTNTKVKDLELIDFNIKSSAAAGALAGSASGEDTEISGILVHTTQITDQTVAEANKLRSLQIQSTTGDAGGLVGSMTGGKVEKCAAAVYVSATGNAGGLVGSAVGGSVTDSYAGGHTKDGRYTDLPEGGIDDISVEDVRVNVISSSANAGGLIGSADGVTVQYSYSTASVYGSVPGGLIGSTGSTESTVNYCYSTGKLFDREGDRVHPFVGAGYDTDSYSGNYYLSNVSDLADDYTSLAATSIEGVSSGNTLKTKFIVADKMDAEVYDKTLLVDHGGKYSFPTVKQLHTLNSRSWSYPAASFFLNFTERHIGDWQVPNLPPLPFTFINENTLYSEATLKAETQQVTVALYGESSQNARVFILDVIRDDDKKPVKLRVSKEGYVLNGATGGTIVWLDTSDFTIGTKNSGAGGDNKYYIDLDTSSDANGVFRLTFDDITTNSGHFTQLYNKGAAPLTPGENVTLVVGDGAGSWSEILELKKTVYNDAYIATLTDAEKAIYSETYNPCAKTENSLFGTMAQKTVFINGANTTVNSADIVYYRHLQNLDVSVSNAGSVTTAAKLNLLKGGVRTKISWAELTESYPKVYNYTGDSTFLEAVDVDSDGDTELPFNGIYNPSLIYLDGQHTTIGEMTIDSTKSVFSKTADGSTVGVGNAGFFRVVGSNLTIENLHLQECFISGSANAGSMAAEVAAGKTLTLNTVLSEGGYAAVSTTATAEGKAAGGLVGVSHGVLKISNSAASVFVTAGQEGTAGGSAAGGLVGRVESSGSSTVTLSYVGGHTHDGVYYVDLTDVVHGAERWNIISWSGPSGGIIGEMLGNVGISQSFNTATVYSGADSLAGGIVGKATGDFVAIDGKILDRVYVVSPVADVKLATRYYLNGTSWDPVPDYTEDGNAGSLIGVSTDADGNPAVISGSSGVYFVPSIYKDHYTLTAKDGDASATVSSIKAVGVGTLQNVKLASYYVDADEGADNSIIGTESDALEQVTAPFDDKLISKEFPFSIWTQFAFEGSGVRYFYGDWQPIQDKNSIHLTLHFLTKMTERDVPVQPLQVNEDADEDKRNETQIAVPIPYDGTTTFMLPYPEFEYGFDRGVWYMYYGDQEDGLPADAEPKVYGSDSGISVYFPKADFNAANTPALLDADGNPHVTLVFDYGAKNEKLCKLILNDYDPKTNSDYSPYGGYQMFTLNDDAALNRLDLLFADKTKPMLNKQGYRFRGWYIKDGDSYYPIFKTYYDEVKKTYDIKIADAASSFFATGDVNLFARYDAVVERKLTISFESKVGLPPFEIYFDAETGFKAELSLPGDQAGNPTVPGYDQEALWPTEVNPDDEYITADLNDLKLSLDIPRVDEENLDPRPADLTYTVTYRGGAEKEKQGYVVLYELLDTKKDGSEYSSGESYVPDFSTWDSIKDNRLLYDTTDKGKYPEINTADYAGFMPEGFKLYSVEKFKVLQDPADPNDYVDEIDAQYANKYFATTGEDQQLLIDGKGYKTTYVVVIQYSRKENKLTFDSLGGTYFAPIWYPVGKPLNYVLNDGKHTPSYGSAYTFQKWWVVDADDDEIEYPITGDTKMEDRPTTVRAERTGGPADYKVVYWLENADDDGYSNVATFTVKNGATAGKRLQVTNSGFDISVDADLAAGDRTFYFDDESKLDKLRKIEDYIQLDHVETNVLVNATGGTYVNVYFKRNLYTLRFAIGFARSTDYTKTKYTRLTTTAQALAQHETVYRYIVASDSYEPLKYTTDEAGNRTSYYYTGATEVRNHVSNDNVYRKVGENANMGETHYGISNGTVVELQRDGVVTYTYSYTPTGTSMYQENNGGNSNSTRYGIFGTSDLPQQVYYRNRQWRIKAENNAEVYNGQRYSATGRDTSINTYAATNTFYYGVTGNTQNSGIRAFTAGMSPETYSGTIYGKIRSGRNDYFVQLNRTKNEVITNGWIIKDTSEIYTGDHYIKPASNAAYTENDYTYLSRSMKKLDGKDGDGWYYVTAGAVSTITFDGPFYIATLDSPTYCVSNITNTLYNEQQGDRYNNWLTNKVVTLSGTNPFKDNEYNGTELRRDANNSNNHYKVYYLDVTAKYGANIHDAWPDSYSVKSGLTFIGWLAAENSYFREKFNTTAALKGKYDTLADYMIVVGNKAVTADKGVAHEFRCRYASASNYYVYRHWFLKPWEMSGTVNWGTWNNGKFVWSNTTDLSTLPMELHAEFLATGGSGSYPNGQSASYYSGYLLHDPKKYAVEGRAGDDWKDHDPSNSVNQYNDHGKYAINGLKDTSLHVNQGMIMNFYYLPNDWNLTLIRVDVANGGAQTDLYSDMKYYSQPLDDVLNQYLAAAQASYGVNQNEFGWYDNESGTGSAMTVSSDTKMPDEETTLYLVVRPKPSAVTIDYTGVTPPTGVTVSDSKYTFATEVKYMQSLETVIPAGLTLDSFKPAASANGGLDCIGWKYKATGDTSDTTLEDLPDFFVSQSILEPITLYPVMETATSTRTVTVYVNHVDVAGNPLKVKNGTGTNNSVTEVANLTVGQSHTFAPDSISGYNPVDPSGIISPMTENWLRKRNVGTEDEPRYEITLRYKLSDETVKYTTEYWLILRSDDGEKELKRHIVGLDDVDHEESGSFAFISFYNLPEELDDYLFDSIELIEGTGESAAVADHDPNDPILFLRTDKAYTVRVYVSLNAAAYQQNSVYLTYNGETQEIDPDTMDSIPGLPDGVEDLELTTDAVYTGPVEANGLPRKAGAYGVQLSLYYEDGEGTRYIFWEPDQIDGRPGVTLYINRCDVLLISGDIHIISDTTENRAAGLPVGADAFNDIAQNHNVTVQAQGALSDEVKAALEASVRSNLKFSFSVDAFRTATSYYKDPRTNVVKFYSTSNVFAYERKSGASAGFDENNFNFFKVYGDLYFWANAEQFNEWKAAQ